MTKHNLPPLAAGPLVLLLCAFGPPSGPPQTDIDQAARLIRQARDTQNPADFRQAGAAAARVLASDPESFDAQRYQAMALLGQGDLTAALDLASGLNKRSPDDIGIWAMLSEIQAAQRRLYRGPTLRPVGARSAAQQPAGIQHRRAPSRSLRRLRWRGQFYAEALRRTPQSDAEERSWLLVQSARLLLRAQNLAAAGATLDQAEKLFPGSVQVMEQKAELARSRAISMRPRPFLPKCRRRLQPRRIFTPTPTLSTGQANRMKPEGSVEGSQPSLSDCRPPCRKVPAGSTSENSALTPGAVVAGVRAAHESSACQARKHRPEDPPIEQALSANPKNLAAESELAGACLQKLRESGDGSYLDRVSVLVDRILAQDPGNYEAMRFQNEVDLQKHDFRAVENRARDLLQFEPSDAGAWGNLGDASMELGKYEAAGEAYAKMFAIRPSLASYNRMAWFRFVTGDPASAISLMRDAIDAGADTPENTAWCTAELGDMYFKTGQLDRAMQAYESALAVFPALHRALAGKGKVEAARGNTEAAIDSYERAQAIVPMIEYAGALEDLYTNAGMAKKAQEQRDMIDVIDRLGGARGESTNRNLALILADHRRNMAHALALEQAEIASRPDVYTWDALSWVLFQSGRIEEARAASVKAMRFNTPEPKFREHAEMIAAAGAHTDVAEAR